MANTGQANKKLILDRVQNFLITIEQLKKEKLVLQLTNYSLPSLRIPKDDPFDFLMDLLGTMKGKKQAVQDVLNSVLGDINSINTKLKEGLKKVILKSFFCNNDFIIKPEYTNGSNDIEFSVSSIDYFFLLKTSPLDDVSGAYEISNGLNRYIYDTLNGSAGSTSWQDLLTNVSFNQSTQVLSFRINPKYVNQPVSVFVNDYVESLTIIDNEFFKSLFSMSQKPNKELQKRLQFLNKLINDVRNACAPTLNDIGRNKTEKEAILVDLLNNKGKPLSQILAERIAKYNEYDTLSDDFTNKINQILCQPIQTPITNETVLDAYSQINDEINQLNSILNNIDSVLNNSYQNNANGAGNGIATGGDPITENPISLPTLNIDFKLGIIAQIPNNMSRLLLSPKVIMLFAILTEVGGVEWGEGFESFLQKFTKSLFDMIKTIITQIYEKIYNLVADNIWLIIQGLILQIVGEKTKARLAIILSLLALFDKLNGVISNVDFGNCRSILDALLKLTSLSSVL
jgi:hypothetical protein